MLNKLANRANCGPCKNVSLESCKIFGRVSIGISSSTKEEEEDIGTCLWTETENVDKEKYVKVIQVLGT
jgi:hypothetical protein